MKADRKTELHILLQKRASSQKKLKNGTYIFDFFGTIP